MVTVGALEAGDLSTFVQSFGRGRSLKGSAVGQK